MAALGCSSMDRKDSGEKNATKLVLSCKRNGLSSACYCEEKMETRNNGRSNFFDKLLKINGSVKSNNNNCFPRPTAPTLRSRRERNSSGSDSTKRRRRSSRHDPGDSRIGEPPDSGQLTPVSPDTPDSLEVAAINTNCCNNTHALCNSVPHSKEIADLLPLVTGSNGLVNSTNGLVQNCNGLVSRANGFIHSANGIVANSNGLVSSANGLVVSGCHGIGSSANGLLSSANGVINSANELVTSKNGLVPIRPVTPDTSRSCTPLSFSAAIPSPAWSPITAGRGDVTPSKDTASPAPLECQWKDCDSALDKDEVMEHIRSCHVQEQRGREKVVCLWKGCKVYEKPCSSKSWLDRHILTHCGDKPFRCIVARCGQRFTTQGGLERHVNSHFNAQDQSPNQKNSKHGREDTPTKIFKRKRLKQKVRAVGVKTEDYFDVCVMEGLEHQLTELAERTQLDLNTTNTNITFHSSVIGRRREESGKSQYLLHWTPEDILPDEWVGESELSQHEVRSIPVKQLPPETIINLHPALYHPHRHRKLRRK